MVSRCWMYGSYILRKARSRTALSFSSRKGPICGGVFSSPSHSTVIAPITFDHSVESFASESANTSTDPATSPLRMIGNSFMPAVLICSANPSSETREDFDNCASRAFISR